MYHDVSCTVASAWQDLQERGRVKGIDDLFGRQARFFAPELMHTAKPSMLFLSIVIGSVQSQLYKQVAMFGI